MTLALVVPVLTGAEPHLAAAIDALGGDVWRAARVTDVFLGDGELVLLVDATNPEALVESVPAQPALVDALERFTAFESRSPTRYAIRPLSESANAVPAAGPGRLGFSTGTG